MLHHSFSTCFLNARYQNLKKLYWQWLIAGWRTKREALIMTSAFSLIFHLMPRITQDRPLYVGNYLGVKGIKCWSNILRARVGFAYVTQVTKGQYSWTPYN